MTTLTFAARLPGVDCQPALPAAAQPIRLDVAAFVGFAERGPLDQPVPVEDANQYAAIFGSDLAVAADGGLPIYANLPSAVRAFFDNGGQRCYVVRVAGAQAQAARLPVPGLCCWHSDGTADPVFVDAAWPGAWSAGLEVGTQLLETPLPTAGIYQRSTPGSPGSLPLASTTGLTSILPGDVIRLDLGPSLPGLYVIVQSGNPVQAAAEIAFGPDGLDDAAAVAALPTELVVAGAWLERFDLVVDQHTETADELLERWLDLAFNSGSVRCWSSALQPAESDVPDLTRSMTLRAEPGDPSGFVVPLHMDQLGTAAEFGDPSGSLPGTIDGDDDLAAFDPAALFLDPYLATDSIEDLLTDAAQLTVLAQVPKQLHGIHALLDVDEVAMIAVPDAVHRSWSPVPPPQLPPPPQQPPPPAPVDQSRFHSCDAAAPPAPPAVAPPAPLADPVAGLPQLDDIASYDPAGMLTVQTALVVACAARADATATISLPQHYDGARALEWFTALTDESQLSGSGTAVPPLSFAAYWHPWPQIIEPVSPALAPLRPLPPDGAVCGMIAARELARGAWIGPAHQPLRGPAALTPVLSAAEVTSLFNAQANLLQHQPGMITTLSAHTLCADPSLLQLSVRRLLILLRKTALAQGQRYVFAVNNDRFRQLVRMRFSRILQNLADLGAFLAYQVVTDASVNTADDIDNGRLIISLQIAPSSPVEFITISLVRSGEGLLDVLET